MIESMVSKELYLAGTFTDLQSGFIKLLGKNVPLFSQTRWIKFNDNKGYLFNILMADQWLYVL